MGAAQIGQVVGNFLVCLFIAAVWLLIAKAIPPLRRRPGISNLVAAILVCLVAYSSFVGGGQAGLPMAGAILMLLLLAWNYRRDTRLLAIKTDPIP